MHWIKLKIAFLVISLIGYAFLFFFSNIKNQNLSYESVVYVLDLGPSMGKKSVEGKYGVVISKFEKSKQLIFDLSQKYFKENKKNGIIIFADKAFYYLPPTWDGQYFDKFLSGLSINFLHSKNEQKDVGAALEKLINTSTGVIVYLFSDFENMKDGINQKLYDKIKAKQYKLFFVDIDGKISEKGQKLSYVLGANYFTLDKESIEIQDSNLIFSIDYKYQNIIKYISALFSILGI